MGKKDAELLRQLVTTIWCAEQVGVSRKTILNWVRDGKFPQPIRCGRRTLRYDRDEVAAWLRARQGGQP
jgi:excisionase family DNA binding protein